MQLFKTINERKYMQSAAMDQSRSIRQIWVDNYGGAKTKRERLAQQLLRNPTRIYDRALEYRARISIKRKEEPPSFARLREAGFADPFEISLSMREYVDQLFVKHRPKNETDKVRLLMQAAYHHVESIVFNGQTYYGFKDWRDRLWVNIEDNDNINKLFRSIYGAHLPTTVFRARFQHGTFEFTVINCLEVSLLMVCLLRAAGIPAYLVKCAHKMHFQTIACLADGNYKIDITAGFCRPTHKKALKDRQAIAWFYLSNAYYFFKTSKYSESIHNCESALEMEPTMWRAKLYKILSQVLAKVHSWLFMEVGPDQDI